MILTGFHPLPKAFAFRIFIFLCLFILTAQVTQASQTKHLLWEVTSPTNTVYIAGSVHLLKEGANPLSAVYEQAFSKTKKLVLEVDPALMNQPTTQQMTLAKALYPVGRSLKKSIPKKTFYLVNETAKTLGVNMEALNQYKPWFVAITLTTLQFQKLGFNPEYGVDVYFYKKAQQTGKQVVGFETPEFQINLFADMPSKTQNKLLLQTLEDMNIMENEFTSLISAWENGDLTQLEKILLESFNGYPEIFENIIAKRNRNWEKRIKTILNGSEPCFIVVGAGHLLGKKGLINLLAKHCYSMKQL
jgi:hypothetical protein